MKNYLWIRIGILSIAFILMLTNYVIAEDIYYCESRDITMECVGFSDSGLRCYPNLNTTKGYKDCPEGWQKISELQNLIYDNKKEYNILTKTYTIKYKNDTEISKVRLDTDLMEKVVRGYNITVAKFTIQNFNDYLNPIELMEFYNINDGMKKVNRTFTYKYLDYYDVIIQDYRVDCKERLHLNGSTEKYDCKTVEDGTHINTYEKWIDFNEKTKLKKGNITIAIVVDEVYPNERVDWVMTGYGQQVFDSWAGWEEGWNVGLKSYWGLNENTTDQIRDFDGSATGMSSNTTNKVLGIGSYQSDANGDHIDMGNTVGIDANGTVIVWIWLNLLGTQNMIWAGDNSGSWDFAFTIESDNRPQGFWYSGAPHIAKSQNTTMSQGAWYMLTYVWGSKGMTVYVNGSTVATNSWTGIGTGTINRNWLCEWGNGGSQYIGNFDEVMLWNRSLSQSEVLGIYNSIVAGYGYTTDFGGDVIFPYFTGLENLSIYNNQSVILNLNATDETAFDCFTTNDTSNFNINCSGYLTNLTSMNILNYSLNITINDTSNNLNWTIMTINVSAFDSIKPFVSVVYPVESIMYLSNVSQLNYTYSDGYPGYCWYNNETVNSTAVSAGTNFTNVLSQEGSNTWTVWCNDTSNNQNSSVVNFNRDINIPTVTINVPLAKPYGALEFPIEYEVVLSEEGAVKFSLDGGTTNTTMITTDNLTFTYSQSLLGTDSYNFSVYANDTAGNTNYTESVVFTVIGVSYLQFWRNKFSSIDVGKINNMGDFWLRGGLNVTKNLNVVGNITGNQIYGGMWYHNHTATEINFAVDGFYYRLFFTNATNLNGFSFVGGFDSSSNLTAQVAGKYLVSYMASGDGQNNEVYFTAVYVDEVNKDNCESHKKMSAGGDIVTMSGTCIIDLAVGDDVSLRTADIGGTGTGNYYSANLNLVRIGE